MLVPYSTCVKKGLILLLCSYLYWQYISTILLDNSWWYYISSRVTKCKVLTAFCQNYANNSAEIQSWCLFWGWLTLKKYWEDWKDKREKTKGKKVCLKIRKVRFWCLPCYYPRWWISAQCSWLIAPSSITEVSPEVMQSDRSTGEHIKTFYHK